MDQAILTIGIRETAKLLGMSYEKTADMVRAGELPSFRTGRHWKIPVKALERWVEERTAERQQALHAQRKELP